MKHPRFAHAFEVVAELPDSLRGLRPLANNLRWTWHEPTRALFAGADKQLWDDVEHNPVELLNRLSQEQLARLAGDPSYVRDVALCESSLAEYLSAETWFDKTFPDLKGDLQVAYFCAEFGITEALPIYSGGLGVLAGDHLKAASDLGVPVVGVGLLYSRGYFRQVLTPDGWQQEDYRQIDSYRLPLQLVRGPDERPLRVHIENGREPGIACQVWRADVGRVPLYLLDSNVLENAPGEQGITDTLYGGDQETRILQEIVLGIGGLRALKELGVRPTVCHMNEGHSAFLCLERIRQLMLEHGTELRVARQAAAAGNVFTTHTPVPAGFDAFPEELLERHVARTLESLGLTVDDLQPLGRRKPEDTHESFNMAVFAIRSANHVNAVSALHAEVSRAMFHELWPDYPEDEVPIASIPNGVHVQSWVGPAFADLFDRQLGTGWRQDPADPSAWEGVRDISDEEIWEARSNQRGSLVRFARRRLQRDRDRRGWSRLAEASPESILDPRILTVGFARRFATYKRANLILSDKERLKRLLLDSSHPIQFIVAGKSHPRDDEGKRLIQELIGFIEHEGVRARMVFIEDYDIGVAQKLVQGVDLWLNTPRRPLEASGTSGMKVLANGGLNCSILDGWWDEAFAPGLGWAIGSRREGTDPGQQDWSDARALYELLESEIVPKFYSKTNGGPPTLWVEMVKRSIAALAHRYSSDRMVRRYVEAAYLPAHRGFRRLDADGQRGAAEVVAWKDKVQAHWSKVRVVRVSDTAAHVNRLGDSFEIVAEVELGGLAPDDVRVQAVLGEIAANRELLTTRIVDLRHSAPKGTGHEYRATTTCIDPGHQGYTVRIVPSHPDVAVPQELNLVRWEELV